MDTKINAQNDLSLSNKGSKRGMFAIFSCATCASGHASVYTIHKLNKCITSHKKNKVKMFLYKRERHS